MIHGVLPAALVAALWATSSSAEVDSALRVVLPRAAEFELALSAAPEHLRAAAAAYVFTAAGYELVREGTRSA